MLLLLQCCDMFESHCNSWINCGSFNYDFWITFPFWNICSFWSTVAQVNLFQKHLFLHQPTHNMTKDCSLDYEFSTWKSRAQNMGRTCCVHKFLFWMSKQKQKTICVRNIFFPCSELGIFMYWTCNSMNNLWSYCGVHKLFWMSKQKIICVHNMFWSWNFHVLNS